MTLWIVTVYKLLWNILAFPTAIYTNLFNMLLIMVKLPSLEAAYLAMYLIPYVVSGKAVLLHQLFSHYLFRLLKGVYVVYSHMPVSAQVLITNYILITLMILNLFANLLLNQALFIKNYNLVQHNQASVQKAANVNYLLLDHNLPRLPAFLMVLRRNSLLKSGFWASKSTTMATSIAGRLTLMRLHGHYGPALKTPVQLATPVHLLRLIQYLSNRLSCSGLRSGDLKKS